MAKADDWREAVGGAYRDHLEAHPAPGLAAGIVAGGRLAAFTGLGVADLESGAPVGERTFFRIASMTKTFTALALLILRDEGRLALDDPLERHVPEARTLAPPTSDCGPVTLRALLNHTAGFVTDDAWADRRLGLSPAEFTGLITGGGLFAQPPGVAFEYSNLGYGLLGRAIGRIAGVSAQAFITERLLGPLGMEETGFDYAAAPRERRATGYRRNGEGWSAEPAEPDGEFSCMGGMVTTPVDYARFVAFLLDAWPPRDRPEGGPLRRASVRELGMLCGPPLGVNTHQHGQETIAISSAYGLGMVSSRDAVLGGYLHHASGLPGWGSHVLVAPEGGVGAFAFATHTYAPLFRANWRALAAVRKSGPWRAPSPHTDVRLERAARAVAAAYSAGAMAAAPQAWSDNLLADACADERDAELSRLAERLGAGAFSRLEPRHALGGRLILACQNGDLVAEIVLAPGPEGRVQKLVFEAPA
jgi:CubicO group peptidase (beta-lactamase class C family)